MSERVNHVDPQDRSDDLLLQRRTSGDSELEVWATNGISAPFEPLVKKPVRLAAAVR